jgi:hypothetical protein
VKYAAAVLILTLTGCGLFPDGVDVCYVHPVYGQVCVKVGGKKHYAENLTPAQRAEVEKWIAEKESK